MLRSSKSKSPLFPRYLTVNISKHDVMIDVENDDFADRDNISSSPTSSPARLMKKFECRKCGRIFPSRASAVDHLGTKHCKQAVLEEYNKAMSASGGGFRR